MKSVFSLVYKNKQNTEKVQIQFDQIYRINE